jgi:hypothetical protein
MKLLNGSRLWIERGFLRINLFGYRFVLIDSRRHFVVYSDRTNGRRVGPFFVRLHSIRPMKP